MSIFGKISGPDNPYVAVPIRELKDGSSFILASFREVSAIYITWKKEDNFVTCLWFGRDKNCNIVGSGIQVFPRDKIVYPIDLTIEMSFNPVVP